MIIEIKNSLDGLNSRVERTEETLNETEARLMDISQYKKNKEKAKKR